MDIQKRDKTHYFKLFTVINSIFKSHIEMLPE